MMIWNCCTQIFLFPNGDDKMLWDAYDDDDMCAASVEGMDVDVKNCYSFEPEKQLMFWSLQH